MIFPNPFNTARYVAIIGYNQPGTFSLGKEKTAYMDITDYGWYDYKIWKANNPDLVRAAGYFDTYWQLENN